MFREEENKDNVLQLPGNQIVHGIDNHAQGSQAQTDAEALKISSYLHDMAETMRSQEEIEEVAAKIVKTCMSLRAAQAFAYARALNALNNSILTLDRDQQLMQFGVVTAIAECSASLSPREFRLLHNTTSEIIEAMRILKGIAGVAIYGSARTNFQIGASVAAAGDANAQTELKAVEELSQWIARDLNRPVITGGGPGIMEAGNQGSFAGGGKDKVVKLGIRLNLGNAKEDLNAVEGIEYIFKYLPLRKLFFSICAQVAHVVFRGGIGTLDELVELIAAKQLQERVKAPIIVVGADTWHELAPLLEKRAEQLLMKPEDRNLFVTVNTIEEAKPLLRQASLQCAV